MEEKIKTLAIILTAWVSLMAMIMGLGFLLEDHPWVFGTSLVALYIFLKYLEKHLEEKEEKQND